MRRRLTILLLLLCAYTVHAQGVRVGAECTDRYLPLLEGKRVALLANHTSIVGDEHLVDRLCREGVNVLAIFSPEQEVNAGGSGCGCAAVVFNGHILPQLKSGKLKRIILMATGALMSPTSSQQGGTIPGVAHALVLEGVEA